MTGKGNKLHSMRVCSLFVSAIQTAFNLLRALFARESHYNQ